MTIEVNSPTRVDLAGGTLDFWPLYLLIGDCVTVNLSIDIMTSVFLEEKSSLEVDVDIRDLSYKKTFANLDELLSCSDKELALHKVHLEYWRPSKGVSIATSSQSPVGGGLGGSSSLCIGMINAFSKWMGVELGVYEKVSLAANLEARLLRTPTGTQDYFPAADPGLNIIHYSVEGPRLEQVPVSKGVFESRMFMVYTGRSHNSGINNWQVYKAAIEGDENTLALLKRFAEISNEVADVCRNQQWQKLPELFSQEYQARSQISSAFASPEIEQLHEIVMGSGGEAVKICGAGGGGCVMVWTAPEKQQEVADVCRKKGFQVLEARPVAR